MLALVLFGVAYTSDTRGSLYWVALAPFIGLICVMTRWSAVKNREAARVRLVWTQLLHWAAVLAAMDLFYVADVGHTMSTDARALYVLTVLALGTFIAGVHISSWRFCLVGVILALGVPAIAWLEQSALLLLLAVVVVIGVGAPLWWRYTQETAPTQ
jgi:Flp pilus assembly protein TadB